MRVLKIDYQGVKGVYMNVSGRKAIVSSGDAPEEGGKVSAGKLFMFWGTLFLRASKRIFSLPCS